MKFLERTFRAFALIVLTLFLFVSAPLLWPVYVGAFIFRPELLDLLFRIKVW